MTHADNRLSRRDFGKLSAAGTVTAAIGHTSTTSQAVSAAEDQTTAIVVDDFASHIRTAREVVRKFDGRLHLYLISSYDPERIPREIKPKKV